MSQDKDFLLSLKSEWRINRKSETLRMCFLSKCYIVNFWTCSLFITSIGEQTIFITLLSAGYVIQHAWIPAVCISTTYIKMAIYNEYFYYLCIFLAFRKTIIIYCILNFRWTENNPRNYNTQEVKLFKETKMCTRKLFYRCLLTLVIILPANQESMVPPNCFQEF